MAENGSSPPRSSPSPARSPPTHDPSASVAALQNLPPLNTAAIRRTPSNRPTSFAQHRLSQYSTNSAPSHSVSRPVSYVYPAFHSSLPYTSVRDFAYPPINPLHYGPPPDPSGPASGTSTPISESHRRLSDPNVPSWSGATSGGWSSLHLYNREPLPYVFTDHGPPYSEDEDLQSPVVIPSRSKRQKGRHSSAGGRKASERSSRLAMTDADGNETFYNGTHNSQTSRYSRHEDGSNSRRNSHFATFLPSRSYTNPSARSPTSSSSSAPSSPNRTGIDPSDPNAHRYSRDYQFSIGSSDEEMHGKAVALFDFARENENELPLIEGQVILVSYRHGQGWLVAEDPRTGESGLVPEEYVRLLRDIEGGWGGLAGTPDGGPTSPQLLDTPTASHDATFSQQQPKEAPNAESSNSSHLQPNGQQQHSPSSPPLSAGSTFSASAGHRPSIVSTFSTSSKDLDRVPGHLLGSGPPPQVVHYNAAHRGSSGGGGSQLNTPTQATAQNLLAMEALKGRRPSTDRG